MRKNKQSFITIFFGNDDNPFHILNNLVECLHLLFIPFDIGLEMEDDILFLFLRKKEEERKDGYFN